MRRDEALLLLGEYAADQHGLVTTAQARDLGIDDVTITRLTRAGHLLKVGHGIHQLASAPDPSHLSVRVAWLRLDSQRPAWERHTPRTWGAVVSHASAARMHDLGDLPAERVELTTPTERTTRDKSVRLHTATLAEEEVILVEGLPTTTPPRTITDLLAKRLDGGHIGGVVADAEQSGLIDLDELAERITPEATAYGFPGKDGHQVIEDLVRQAQRRLGAQVRNEQMHDVAAVSSAMGALAGSLATRFDLPYGEVAEALGKIVAGRSRLDMDVMSALRDDPALRRIRNDLALPAGVQPLTPPVKGPLSTEPISGQRDSDGHDDTDARGRAQDGDNG